MKKIITIALVTSLLTSCLKKEIKWEGNTSVQYTITGKLYKQSTMLPIRDFGIALRQSDKSFDERYDYKSTDPKCITDSNGYFSISYFPTDYNGGVNLYKIPKDYSCCIDLDILDNITKGKDLDVGVIYY